MKKVVRAWCACLLCLWLPAFASAKTARAAWVWEPDAYAMLESRAEADHALAFLHAHRVDTLYLYADAYAGRNLIVDAPDAYRRFIVRAHRDGFRVYALLGSAFLHTEEYVRPAQRPQALAMLRRVLDYNAAAPAGARFDGINYDIEPHLLADWDSHRDALLQGFVDMTAAFVDARRAAGQRLPIGPAMPFWWDGISLPTARGARPVSELVADLCDYVALMDYRNHAEGSDGIVAHAADEMRYAERTGKQVVVGLELTPGEPAKITFAGRGEADLAREMDATARAFGDSPAFAGFALHHYRGYVDWVRAQAPRGPSAR
ncbi:MAG: hypothetical protein HOQ02_07745 [Lysobacter sp.]|nr:hypothetical protein [Lysobacter sp.]